MPMSWVADWRALLLSIIYHYTSGQTYTQIKKTVNTENIPGMCDLTDHMRDLVTAENAWVLSHGIELFRKMTRFNLHQFILQKLEVLFLSI